MTNDSQFITPQGMVEASFIELSDFLESDKVPDECMSISELDGFFAALAIGPTTVMPSIFINEIWGGEDSPEFANQAQAQRIYGLIISFYNEALKRAQDFDSEYSPILEENSFNGVSYENAESWAFGFWSGVELNHEDWKPLLESKDEGYLDLIQPIILAGTEVGLVKLSKMGEAVETKFLETFPGIIPDVVKGINAYWLLLRKAHARSEGGPKVKQGAQPDGAEVIGRNEICPCGSGKKYKYCHGKQV